MHAVGDVAHRTGRHGATGGGAARTRGIDVAAVRRDAGVDVVAGEVDDDGLAGPGVGEVRRAAVGGARRDDRRLGVHDEHASAAALIAGAVKADGGDGRYTVIEVGHDLVGVGALDDGVGALAARRDRKSGV